MTKYIDIFSKQALDNLPESYAEKVAFYRGYLAKMGQGKTENLFELVGSYSQFKQIEEDILKCLNEQNRALYGEFCEENRKKIEGLRAELNRTLSRRAGK